MKARKVKGLDPDEPLADNLQRIIAVRLDELCGFMPEASDPEAVTALHDMRIAAKRLRYILEIGAPCFGPYAETAGKRTKDVQDLIGEIHDCDETIPRVRALIAQAQTADAYAARGRAAADAEDLDPRFAADAPQADVYRGLHTILTFLHARRGMLFARFLELWTELERQGFRSRLEYALDERLPSTVQP
ncbi:MAG TPA: CHAD domain-containing protein [Solirubrobacteraceae bacterium]